jgi:UDP-N-acetyl-2-amino-2-deoxyglucuronate dehydrogenase
MKRILRLGFVGCGDIARWMAVFARLNRGIRLVACHDAVVERADTFARRFHIQRSYRSYSEMLEQEAMDAVYLAVPHHLHHSMAADAIREGLPVLVEKPLARTLAEGREIVQLAQKQDVSLGVNFQYRYDAGCYALAHSVQQGELGQIYYARCNVPWHRNEAYFQSRWRARLDQAGGGTLITQGSHALDAVLWALGRRPVMASGHVAQRRFQLVEIEDLAQGTIELEDGALVQFSSSMVASPEQAIRIEVYGSRGTATYSDRPLPHVRFRGVRIKRARLPHWGVHALQRSLEGFRAWVMEGVPYLIPAREALPVLAVVEAVYRSARSGHSEPVESWTTSEPKSM